MREWDKDDVWIEGGPQVGPFAPNGYVTVEKDWWLSTSPQLNGKIVERHNFRPGTVRSFQKNYTREEQLELETVIPGVKSIGIDRSIDADAASITVSINNTRFMPPGEVAPTGTGEGVDARNIGIDAREPVLGDPGYLSPFRGQTVASEGLWGFVDEQPITYRRFGSADLDFASYNGTYNGSTGSEDRSYDDAWDHDGARHQQVSDVTGATGHISNLFEYSPGFRIQAEARPVATREGGARAFVAAGAATVNGESATPIPDLGRPITGVQVWAFVSHNPDLESPTYATQVLWKPCLMMWDPEFGANDPAEETDSTPDPGGPRMFTNTVFTTTAVDTAATYVASNMYGSNPVTGEPWTRDSVNDLISGINPYTDDLTDGFGVNVIPNAGWNHRNDGTGTDEPNAVFGEDELRIYSIWLEVRVGPPVDSWAAALVPNALLRTYQGYGTTGDGLAADLAEGHVVQTGCWLVDEVNQSSSGELELKGRDMAKLLITQIIYPPLIEPSEYPVVWGYNFKDSVPIANRTNSGLGGGDAGTYGPARYGRKKDDNTDAEVQHVSGNFRDWSEIVRWHLLWAGWWLSPLIDRKEDQFEYSFANSARFPVVYGNIENTNSHPTGSVDSSIFKEQPVINAITRIKEYVGYLFRIDCEGAARFEPPNFWTPGNFLDDGTHIPPTEKMYVIDEEKQLTDYTVSYSDQSVRTEIIISSYEPTVPLDDTVTTHYLTPNRDLLRGMVRPWPWVNGTFTTGEDQRRMAELVAVHFWFAQRQGQVRAPANPAIDVDDQVLIFERVTSETTIHYVRGVSSHMDLDTGDYTMNLVTHWMGTPEEWQGIADFYLSPEIAEWLNSTTGTANRGRGDSQENEVDGKVTRGGGFEVSV